MFSWKRDIEVWIVEAFHPGFYNRIPWFRRLEMGFLSLEGWNDEERNDVFEPEIHNFFGCHMHVMTIHE